MPDTYPTKLEKQFIKAIASLETEAEVKNFLRDVLTRRELCEAAKRYEIARLLWQNNHTYAEIAKKLQTSTTTVTRVADWLHHKPHQGYHTILKRLFPKPNR